MPKNIKYTIFKTRWGYFGLAASDKGLVRTHLPWPDPEKLKSQLLKNIDPAKCDKQLLKKLQEQIAAYFDGTSVNFGQDIAIDLNNLSKFTQQVLTACRKIELGRTISYLRLAKSIHRPNSARAVGGVMAKNPLPLIVPCHRIIKSDGKIGGFSASGGVSLKSRLLKHEHKIITP